MDKSAVVISETPAITSRIIASLENIQVKVRPFGNPAEAIDSIQTEVACGIFVEASTEKRYQEFEDAIQNKLGLFSDVVNPNTIFYFSDKLFLNFPFLVQSPLFGNFLQIQADAAIPTGFLSKSIQHCLTEKSFGLNHLFPEPAKIQKISLQISSQKTEAVEAIREYLLAAKFPKRVAGIIASATDELLLNALFDAPVDPSGRQLYATSAPFSSSIRLEGRGSIEVALGYDGNYFGVSVLDFFGNVDRVRYLTQMTKSYAREDLRLKSSPISVGTGMSYVFKFSSGIFLCTEVNARTEVSAVFRKVDSVTRLREEPKFVCHQTYF